MTINAAQEKKIQPSALKNKSETFLPAVSDGSSLSMHVAKHLLGLMEQIKNQEVTPASVNAACNCAAQMINLMKLNVKLREIEK